MKKFICFLILLFLIIPLAQATITAGNITYVLNTTSGPSSNAPGYTNGPLTTDGTNVSNTGIYLPRVVALTDASTITLNTGTTDIGELSSLSQTSNFANPTGTPHDGQNIIVEILSSASQTLTWGSAFEGSSDIALPTSTSGSSYVDIIGFKYLGLKSKWGIFALSRGYP